MTNRNDRSRSKKLIPEEGKSWFHARMIRVPETACAGFPGEQFPFQTNHCRGTHGTRRQLAAIRKEAQVVTILPADEFSRLRYFVKRQDLSGVSLYIACGFRFI